MQVVVVLRVDACMFLACDDGVPEDVVLEPIFDKCFVLTACPWHALASSALPLVSDSHH